MLRLRKLILSIISSFVIGLPLQTVPCVAQSTDMLTNDGISPLDGIEQDYLNGRYEDVIRRSDLLLEVMPGMNEARFLRGTAYWQKGDWGAATADLEEYLERGGQFEKEAAEILARAARQAKPRRVLRYGLRAGVLHSDRVVRRELARGDPRRESVDTGLRLDWSLESGPARPWTMKYRGSLLEYFDVTEASWLAESLDLIGRWPVAEGRGAFEWRIGGEYLRKDDRPDLWRAASRCELAWAFDHCHVGWAALEAAYDDYPADSEFNGPPFLAGLGCEHRFGDIAVFWSLYGLVQESKLDAVSHFETGCTAGAGRRINDRLNAGCVIRASDAEFDNYDAIFSTKRSDLYHSTEVWAALELGKGWRVSPFVEYAANHSNIEEDDYNRLIFGLDLIWGVL